MTMGLAYMHLQANGLLLAKAFVDLACHLICSRCAHLQLQFAVVGTDTYCARELTDALQAEPSCSV